MTWVKEQSQKVFFAFALALLLFPLGSSLVFAQFDDRGMSGGSGGGISGGSGGLRNPLSFDSIQEFIERALEALVMIALPVIVFFIVYAGFKFVLAQGNEEELKKAKRNFMWLLVGAVLILGAWILAQLIGGTIDQLRGA